MNETLQLDIKKELNINIKKIQISINNSQNEIQALFEREEYDVKYIKFSTVIENNGTVEEFYKNLDLYIESEISKIRSINSRGKEER